MSVASSKSPRTSSLKVDRCKRVCFFPVSNPKQGAQDCGTLMLSEWVLQAIVAKSRSPTTIALMAIGIVLDSRCSFLGVSYDRIFFGCWFCTWSISVLFPRLCSSSRGNSRMLTSSSANISNFLIVVRNVVHQSSTHSFLRLAKEQLWHSWNSFWWYEWHSRRSQSPNYLQLLPKVHRISELTVEI